MQQVSEVARVKLRIKALCARTIDNGCTEAEALSAAAKVGELLDRYALSMDEIELRAEPCVTLTIPLRGVKRRPIDRVLVRIADFCDCKVWFHTSRLENGCRAKSYRFFGLEGDTAMAGYLYAVIDRAMDHASAAFCPTREDDGCTAGAWRGYVRSAKHSFQIGMAARISTRLREMGAERVASVARQQQAQGTGTALVLVKQTIIEEAFRQTNIKISRAPSASRPRNVNAYHSGQKAGNTVNLHRPVGQDGRALLA